jgi:hypothetical protein
MNETINSLQDLIFVLEHSLRIDEKTLWEMPYKIAKHRYRQLEKFNEEQKKEMEKQTKGSHK